MPLLISVHWASPRPPLSRRPSWSRWLVVMALPPIALVALMAMELSYHVYLDRSGLPDLDAFLRFEAPRIGEISDERGAVLIELAREYRRVVSYDQVPPVVRQAILSAEDKNFFSHSGVEYRSLPRVMKKAALHSLQAWWRGGGFRARFPQGGSTLTQQLVRSYFLKDLTTRENDGILINAGGTPRLLSLVLGAPATNKLLRKVEEIRLSLWLEDEMRRRLGSRERAKREIFARYASFIYMGNGRYGFAAASEYYFGKPLSALGPEDAGDAALLAGINKAPRDYAPAPDDPRPLRRRNAILALMAKNGYISPELAKRCQSEPVRVVARGPMQTAGPGAVANVLEELKQHGGDRFGIEDLFMGRILVRSTVNAKAQIIVKEALENGLALYEKRHGESKGLIQGSVVVLRNADAAILAEVGGRQVYNDRFSRYSDLNRVTASLRQPGSAWKPMVYLAAFQKGLGLDTKVPDAPIRVSMGRGRGVKWIANYDRKFKGSIPLRQALAESRNAVAVWIARKVGMDNVNRTARELGIHSPLNTYITTALGAAEVRLLELANAYRVMASGLLAEPYVVARVIDPSGEIVRYKARAEAQDVRSAGADLADLSLIQEGLRGVIRLPLGTAHALDSRDFPIQVMGKTGTTSNFRDALFVGSTYGPAGITVAVRVGFDDNRALGDKETGARTALPIFREIMLRLYNDRLVGPAPRFPGDIEARIDDYLENPAPAPNRRRRPPTLVYGAALLPASFSPARGLDVSLPSETQ